MGLSGRVRGRAASKGMTLLEVMIASALMVIMCVTVISYMLKVDHDNRYLHNRTIAYRAAHEMMEILLADEMDSMLLQSGVPFAVTQLTTGTTTGNIAMTDLNWNAVDQAYLITITIPAYDVVLCTVRTRS